MAREMTGKDEVIQMKSAIRMAWPLVFSLLLPSLANAQTVPDWEWMSQRASKAIDDLLPIKREFGMHVGYRSAESFRKSVLEYSFVIGFDPKEGGGISTYLTAHVKMPDTVSIYDQIEAMHRSNPQEDISTIQSRVKIKEWDLTEKGCSAIRVQFNRFQKLNIKPPEFQLIIMDPLVHEFYVETGAGRLDIHTYDWKSALVSWALQTRQALDNCIRVKSRDR